MSFLFYWETLEMASANQSIPNDELVGWQANSGRRGTFEIIQTCAITVFACTWTIQHLNVPGPNDSKLLRILRSCKWMVINILLPEFILSHAIFERQMATEVMREMTKNDHPHVSVALYGWPAFKSWAKAKMGRRSDGDQDLEGNTAQEQHQVDGSGRKQQSYIWTLSHAYFANMGGFVREVASTGLSDGGDPAGKPTEANQGKTSAKSTELRMVVVTGMQLARCWNEFEPPGIDEQGIEDKSKSNAFASIVTILQISQLVLSLIARKYYERPFSQIETLTLTLAICGVGTSLMYMDKPKDVTVPIQVHYAGKDRKLDQQGLTRRGTYMNFSTRTFDGFWSVLSNDIDEMNLKERVPNDNIPIEVSEAGHSVTYVLAFVTAVFGSLHAIAWNFEYPTPVEQLLWRIGTIVSVASPLFGLAGIHLSQITLSSGRDAPSEFLDGLVILLREMVWDEQDKDIKHELNRIRHALDMTRYPANSGRLAPKKLFRQIFVPPSHPEQTQAEAINTTAAHIQDAIKRVHECQAGDKPNLPNHFQKNFSLLVDLMNGKGTKKMQDEVARTNVFPRKPMPYAINKISLWVTTAVYCIARLIILAVGFSSLRSMPDGVYIATWTRYIPSG